MKYGIAIKSSLLTLVCTAAFTTTAAYADDMNMAPAASSAQGSTDSDKNKSAGQAFLSANKTKPGVKTTADGLQYKVITQGTGATPSDTDVVSVNYSGKLLDGTEFDSSYKRGEPASFPVNGVIPGWTEALKLMKEGSVYELYIPAELAYGTNGSPPSIGPDETLVFKVELLKILR
jgi:FKBP-type peptidyl-prolyl cis-trans isomerase FklB